MTADHDLIAVAGRDLDAAAGIEDVARSIFPGVIDIDQNVLVAVAGIDMDRRTARTPANVALSCDVPFLSIGSLSA